MTNHPQNQDRALTARLAPPGRAVVHVAKYLQLGAAHDARSDERELEGFMNLLQPGWNDVVVARRFSPALTVSHASVAASTGGLHGRPDGPVPGIPGLYVVGDWVGQIGQLSDASLASAKSVAFLVSHDLRHRGSHPAALTDAFREAAN